MKKLTDFDIEEIPLLCKSLRFLGEVRLQQEGDKNVMETLENAAQIFEILGKKLQDFNLNTRELRETFLPAAKANRKKFLKTRRDLEKTKDLLSRLLSVSLDMYTTLVNRQPVSTWEIDKWNLVISDAEKATSVKQKSLLRL